MVQYRRTAPSRYVVSEDNVVPYPNRSSARDTAGAFLDVIADHTRELYARAADDLDGHGACYELVADILVQSIPTHTPLRDLRHRPLNSVADQIALALFTAHRSLSPHTVEADTLAELRRRLTAARDTPQSTAAQLPAARATTNGRRPGVCDYHLT